MITDATTRISKSIIPYPRFEELVREIEQCIELSKATGEPHCMLLDGETGTGKSTVIKYFVRENKRYEASTGIVIPHLILTTPSPVTVKGMASVMLEKIGDPAYDRGSQTSMNARLVNLIKECNVEMVILDEIQHLIRSDTDKVLNDVSDWLKVLIKETGVPFLIVGIKGKAKRILQANSQLERLFPVRETLKPFGIQDLDSLSNFILTIEQNGLIKFSDDLSRQELVHRIYCATCGTVGHIKSLLVYASFLQQEQNLTEITPSLLSQAFIKRLSTHLNVKNPFEYPRTKEINIF